MDSVKSNIVLRSQIGLKLWKVRKQWRKLIVSGKLLVLERL
jgi:hypothetical protein